MNRWFLLFLLALFAAFVGTRLFELFGDALPPGTLAVVHPLHINRMSGVQKADFYADDGLNDRLPQGIEVRVLKPLGPKQRSRLATADRVRVEILMGTHKGRIGYMARNDLGPAVKRRRGPQP
ncbi:MAG: hypothetical protein P4L84_19815 [Isosphaeraceae bacterium]|nr:hypothetical protein [Isosphaeraceae bacterium]